MTEMVLTYILLALFFGMDQLIRKDKTAKSVETTSDDKKSTILILATFFIVLILSVILNIFKVGTFQNTMTARIGLAVMLTGFCIRILSMLTLSKYYTRTLVTVGDQKIVKTGIYKVIRHPGYLGTILIWGAAGIGMSNMVILIAGTVLILLAYFYRITNEEKMLQLRFGDEYTSYMKSTWRLIPLLW